MIFYRMEMLRNASTERSKVCRMNFVSDDEMRTIEDEVR